jgi:hypothetical protein
MQAIGAPTGVGKDCDQRKNRGERTAGIAGEQPERRPPEVGTAEPGHTLVTPGSSACQPTILTSRGYEPASSRRIFPWPPTSPAATTGAANRSTT